MRPFINGNSVDYYQFTNPFPTPPNNTFDETITWTIPSIAANDKMFFTFEYLGPAENGTLYFLDNNSMTFGY
jgi:hypothetical protein